MNLTKYKLIALDLDETLLDSFGQLGDKTIEVISRIQEQNVKIIVCTGRIFGSARYFAKKLNTKTFIVANNGALISDYNMNHILLKKELDRNIYLEIIRILDEENVYYHFYDAINLCTKKLNNRSQNYKNWNEQLDLEDRINIKIIANPHDYLKKEEMSIYKIVVSDDCVDKIANIKEKLKKFDVEIISSFRNSFDIMSKKVSKGTAIEVIASYYDINPCEIIAIGDNENDISMIEFAGLGVAVENAELNVKKISNEIIKSNKEQGVALFLEKLML